MLSSYSNITCVLSVPLSQDVVIKMLHVDPHQRLTAPQVGCFVKINSPTMNR